MKIAGWIFVIIGSLSLLGALLGGNRPVGPLFWVGLGITLLYFAKNKSKNNNNK